MSALSDHLLSHLDIVSLVSRYVSLKKAGTNYAGLCPFHSEKSPSFLVSPTKQIYKCFGCGKGGNAIGFVMEIERLDYGDAVRMLAEQERIDISEFEQKWQSSPEYKTEKEKAKRINKLAQEFFVNQLWQGAQDPKSSAGVAYHYAKEKRGLSDQMIKQLGLGYAPSQSHSFFAYFQQHGFSTDDIIALGLAKQGTNEVYSFFRDRLIIPIRDQLGNIIGFGARALQEGQEPKYLNSPESIIYDKSKILYGLDHLKKGVKDHQRIIIVEGYFDVIALQRVGLDIGVATCGTSLTAQHMEILKRYHEHIYLLFDNDKAGATATLRALSIAYEQGVYPQVINLKQSATPVKDIDELLSQDDDPHTHIQDLITQAHDGFRWALHYYLQHHTLHNPVERQKILHGVFDLVYATKQMSTQNLFLEQVAQELGIDYTLILSQYRQYAKTEKKLFRHRHEQPTQTSQVSEQRHSQKELLLGALLRNNFWQTLQLDPLWIEHLQQFVQLVQYQGAAQESEYDERQLWREQELAMHDGASRTHIAKQVLLPYFHSLQKTALKIVDQESKQELLRIIQALR